MSTCDLFFPRSPRGLEVVSRSCRPHWAAALGTAGLLELEEMQQTVAMELRPDGSVLWLCLAPCSDALKKLVIT